MRKKIISGVILCMMLALLNGCSKDSGQTPPIEDKPNIDLNVDKDSSTEDEILSKPDISAEALAKEKETDELINLKNVSATSGIFRLNGTTYSLPFSYARICNTWSFALEDYGYDENFVLEPGQKTSDTIRLFNPQVDYEIIVGLSNPYDVPITIKESKVWSISISISESEKKPSIKLPGGLNWKSSFVDVTLVYPDPAVPFIHDMENKLYHYSFQEYYNSYLFLDISEETGIVGFTMKKYD